jgi:hypothetical protein
VRDSNGLSDVNTFASKKVHTPLSIGWLEVRFYPTSYYFNKNLDPVVVKLLDFCYNKIYQ